jgi:hypothetical protein
MKHTLMRRTVSVNGHSHQRAMLDVDWPEWVAEYRQHMMTSGTVRKRNKKSDDDEQLAVQKDV